MGWITVGFFKGTGRKSGRAHNGRERGEWGRLKTRNETENGSNHKSIIYRMGVLFLKKKKKERKRRSIGLGAKLQGPGEYGLGFYVIGGRKEAKKREICI